MLKGTSPRVEDAPGLVWRPLKDRWEARWQCRTDLAQKGFYPKSVRLWTGLEPTPAEARRISDRCQHYQSSMLVFGRGGIPQVATSFDGTIKSLIACYQTDADSGYRKLRYRTRMNYDTLTDRIEREHGDARVADLKARTLLRWHEAWTADGKVAMAHSLVGMLRTLFSFGATILEDAQCARMKGLMADMRFKMAKPRQEHINAKQVETLRAVAHKMGLHSIALAQAFQFELMLRQKDVIGEWVPRTEPGPSDVLAGASKWMVGLRWQEIDANLILRHTTSKRQKDIEVDLKLAPMVMEELRYAAQRKTWGEMGAKAILESDIPALPVAVSRSDLPASGPVIVSEIHALPWQAYEFRRQWRRLARMAGIPDHVFNMDSRAGGITEATNAGAELEDVRHAATHSQISMTARYSRGAAEKVAKVMQLRVAGRNKPGTNEPGN